MFNSNLKQILFIIQIILTNGSHSLIIDLSYVLFFHKFYHHLINISKVETAVIGPKQRSGRPSKKNQTNKINYFLTRNIL